jgi:hypothetical protein
MFKAANATAVTDAATVPSLRHESKLAGLHHPDPFCFCDDLATSAGNWHYAAE